jgi:chromosome partitioning protein
MAARVYSFPAQKGGVGKSTFTIQGALVTRIKLDKRVLLIDVDPQRNSSSVFLSDEQLANNTECLASMLYQECNIMPITGNYGVDVIPGDDGINNFPQDLTDGAFDMLLKELKSNGDVSANDIIKEVVDSQLVWFIKNVQRLQQEYDYIFIDVPPSFLGLPLISALCASTDIVGLVEPNRFSSDVIEGFIEKVTAIRSDYNPSLHFHGFVINKFRGNSVRHGDKAKAWREAWPEFFLGSPVRINSWIEDSTEDGEPVWKGANNANRRDGAKSIIRALAKVIPELKKALTK